MATYVLVHGGGHGGWCYQKVARLLRAAGHEAYTPTLTGLGERSHLLSPAIDLDSHITDVVALLTFEDLRDVILVGHSYGGMVITGVADRASDRVGTVVSLDAANPVNGQSLVDVAGPVIEMTRPHGQVVDGVELVLLPAPGAASTLATRDPKLTDRARAAGMLWEIDTGHDLMVTEPEAVASALLEIAAR
ncbi:MAG: alpha/beta fold hydrolase [Acidimicrobiia bacterium]